MYGVRYLYLGFPEFPLLPLRQLKQSTNGTLAHTKCKKNTHIHTHLTNKVYTGKFLRVHTCNTFRRVQGSRGCYEGVGTAWSGTRGGKYAKSKERMGNRKKTSSRRKGRALSHTNTHSHSRPYYLNAATTFIHVKFRHRVASYQRVPFARMAVRCVRALCCENEQQQQH